MHKNICFFGDSIIWGKCDYERNGGWLSRLRHYIENEGFDYWLYNCGINGDNTDKLIKRFKAEALARKADILFFSIGVNDSRYVENSQNVSVPVDRFRANLENLVSEAKNITKEIFFIEISKVDEARTMPVEWDRIKFYNNKNIITYNQILFEICKKNDLSLIKMFDLLDSVDLSDGLHPNPKGYEKMFLRIKEELIKKGLI